ncbi:hypothetical protein HDZ31DRAFT_82938 [Schizophyllum fasciatum]
MCPRRPISPLALRGSLNNPLEGVRQSLARLDGKLDGCAPSEQLATLQEAALAELYFIQSASRLLRSCARGRTLVTEGLAMAVRTRREQATVKLSSIVRRMDMIEHCLQGARCNSQGWVYTGTLTSPDNTSSSPDSAINTSTCPDFVTTRMAELAQQLSEERRRFKAP